MCSGVMATLTVGGWELHGENHRQIPDNRGNGCNKEKSGGEKISRRRKVKRYWPSIGYWTSIVTLA